VFSGVRPIANRPGRATTLEQGVVIVIFRPCRLRVPNGTHIEVAQRMAGHSNAKTTGLYNRRNADTLDDIAW
jgi:hypothetical protein